MGVEWTGSKHMDYMSFCADMNNEAFQSFKSHPAYNYVLEHVTPAIGQEYLEKALKLLGEIDQDKLALIHAVDAIGGPRRHDYSIGMVSPTTCRYLKVFADIQQLCGSLSDIRILEIGGGYGGQAAITYIYDTPSSYTIFDIPEVLNISKRFISEASKIVPEIGDVVLLTPQDPCDAFDLLISNYALCELPAKAQVAYLDKIGAPAHGYVACNDSNKFTWGLLHKKFPQAEYVPYDMITVSRMKQCYAIRW